MFFSSNIKFLRKRKGRTQDDVAVALDIKRSTLSGYENNVAAPGIHALITFSDYFNISIDTMIRIDLSQLSESQLSEIERGFDVFIKGSRIRVLTTTVDNKNNENIELVHEKAKAGYTQGFADPEYISELPAFQLPFLSKEKKYRTFQISGDSMLPITEGTWVTGEFVQDWSSIKSKEACIVLTLDEGIVFKVVENKIEDEGKLKLFSLNTFYKPYELSLNEIKEVWRFVHYISDEMPEPKQSIDELLNIINFMKSDIGKIKDKLDVVD